MWARGDSSAIYVCQSLRNTILNHTRPRTKKVGEEGLEPSILTEYDSESYAYTSSAIRPFSYGVNIPIFTPYQNQRSPAHDKAWQ